MKLAHIPAGYWLTVFAVVVLNVPVALLYGVAGGAIGALAVVIVSFLAQRAAHRAPPADEDDFQRLTRRLLASVTRRPLSVVAIALLVLIAVANQSRESAEAEHVVATTKHEGAVRERGFAATNRDSSLSVWEANKRTVAELEAELKSFDAVVAPERELRRIADEAERKRKEAEAEEARKRAEAEAAAKAAEEAKQKEIEDRNAAAEQRKAVIARLKEAVGDARTMVRDTSAKFEEVALDYDPGSLTWIPDMNRNTPFMALCNGVDPSEYGGGCNYVPASEAMNDLRQTYADFFIGRVPLGWVYEKQRRATVAIDAWAAKVNRLR